jgi:hypothetical protein
VLGCLDHWILGCLDARSDILFLASTLLASILGQLGLAVLVRLHDDAARSVTRFGGFEIWIFCQFATHSLRCCALRAAHARMCTRMRANIELVASRAGWASDKTGSDLWEEARPLLAG